MLDPLKSEKLARAKVQAGINVRLVMNICDNTAELIITSNALVLEGVSQIVGSEEADAKEVVYLWYFGTYTVLMYITEGEAYLRDFLKRQNMNQENADKVVSYIKNYIKQSAENGNDNGK